uniref:Uncharacterized protein n=1 Tax=Timema bartmani TaxID=61472 RepID=A0A7R9EZQ3_9NEOP|nr:unnamed protein product [Timema bartmani]
MGNSPLVAIDDKTIPPENLICDETLAFNAFIQRGKNPVSTPNLYFSPAPVIYSLAYHESDALDHLATELSLRGNVSAFAWRAEWETIWGMEGRTKYTQLGFELRLFQHNKRDKMSSTLRPRGHRRGLRVLVLIPHSLAGYQRKYSEYFKKYLDLSKPTDYISTRLTGSLVSALDNQCLGFGFSQPDQRFNKPDHRFSKPGQKFSRPTRGSASLPEVHQA